MNLRALLITSALKHANLRRERRALPTREERRAQRDVRTAPSVLCAAGWTIDGHGTLREREIVRANVADLSADLIDANGNFADKFVQREIDLLLTKWDVEPSPRG